MSDTNLAAKPANENLEIIRSAIQREFIDRCRKNPAYSLRSYARFLEIDQSFLSKLLKGQRAVTADLARNIGPKLGLKPAQIEKIFTAGTKAMPGFLSLSDDELELLSGWHHFAIIELAKTSGFVFNETEIAARLCIHVEEVRDALQRLNRLGFIQLSEKGFKVLAPNTTWTNNKQTSAARKKFQRTLLEKSLDAVDHVPFELRENGSLTVAINTKRLPEFKEKLRQIRDDLSEFLQADGETDLDEVYQLTIALFPLSKVAELKTENPLASDLTGETK